MLIHETQNKRGAYRYTFSSPHGPVIRFCGKQIELMDISAGGVSFKDQGFTKGDRDRVTLILENIELRFRHILSIAIKILFIDSQNVCHCLFENPNKDQAEAIHRFLLIKQKKDLQNKLHPQ